MADEGLRPCRSVPGRAKSSVAGKHRWTVSLHTERAIEEANGSEHAPGAGINADVVGAGTNAEERVWRAGRPVLRTRIGFASHSASPRPASACGSSGIRRAAGVASSSRLWKRA
jgi:hypothetical protein